MSTKYADRAFISINGAALTDVQSASIKQNKNARPVPNMTRNGNNTGFVQGNIDIDITVTIAVQNKFASIKLEAIDYESIDVSLTFQVGADFYTATNLFLKDTDENAAGIGDEVKRTFNFGSLKIVEASTAAVATLAAL